MIASLSSNPYSGLAFLCFLFFGTLFYLIRSTWEFCKWGLYLVYFTDTSERNVLAQIHNVIFSHFLFVVIALALPFQYIEMLAATAMVSIELSSWIWWVRKRWTYVRNEKAISR